MSHKEGKAAVVLNSGRRHLEFYLKFLLRRMVLTGARGSCPAGNHVWAGPAIHGDEHVMQASFNCPMIYYFLLHWKCAIFFWFGLQHNILITEVANLSDVIWSFSQNICLILFSWDFLRWLWLICTCISNSPFELWDDGLKCLIPLCLCYDILTWSPLINFLSKLSISTLF